MERNRKRRSAQRPTPKPTTLELSPDRAFVVHLDTRALPPRHVVGRVEHITSGRVARFASLRELATFLAKALHTQARRE